MSVITTMSLKFSKDDGIQGELEIIGEEISRISSMVNQMDMFSQSAFTVVLTKKIVIKIHILNISFSY